MFGVARPEHNHPFVEAAHPFEGWLQQRFALLDELRCDQTPATIAELLEPDIGVPRHASATDDAERVQLVVEVHG